MKCDTAQILPVVCSEMGTHVCVPIDLGDEEVVGMLEAELVVEREAYNSHLQVDKMPSHKFHLDGRTGYPHVPCDQHPDRKHVFLVAVPI